MKARVSAVLIIVAATIPGAMILSSQTAWAKGPAPSISCTVSGKATLSPGISNTPAKQTLTVTLQLSKCTGSSVAGITGSSPGSSSATGKTTETCANLTKPSAPIKTTTTIDWNNGTTSGVTYTTVLNSGTGTSTGKVTSGTFAKGKISATITYIPGQNCTTVALTSATISGTFSIT